MDSIENQFIANSSPYLRFDLQLDLYRPLLHEWKKLKIY